MGAMRECRGGRHLQTGRDSAVLGKLTMGLGSAGRGGKAASAGLAICVFVVLFAVTGVAPAGAKGTVWLCFPGKSPDPCTPGLSTTVYTPTSKVLSVQHPKAVKHPAIDCFYVYPT